MDFDSLPENSFFIFERDNLSGKLEESDEIYFKYSLIHFGQIYGTDCIRLKTGQRIRLDATDKVIRVYPHFELQ